MSSDFALSIFALCLSVASAVWSAVNIMRQPDEPDETLASKDHLVELAKIVDEELDEIERHLGSLERRVNTLKAQRDEVDQ